ncbi:hypothetical protein ACFWVU_28685 [Streptomyces sp. NPDC058686]
MTARILSVVESLKALRELVVLDQADEYSGHVADTASRTMRPCEIQK